MIEADFFSRLSADTAVAAIVSDRIYPMRAPDDAPEPLIIFSRVSTIPWSVLSNNPSADFVRFQVDCYAETFLAARQLAGAVRTSLQAWQTNGQFIASFQTDRDLIDNSTETVLYRVMAEYLVYSPA